LAVISSGIRLQRRL